MRSGAITQAKVHICVRNVHSYLATTALNNRSAKHYDLQQICGNAPSRSHDSTIHPIEAGHLMDKAEAEIILVNQLRLYKQLSYSDLKDRLGDVDAYEVTGASGKEYQLEFEVHWDGNPDGDLRVLGAIDDGGWSAFCPLSRDFIVSPDGRIDD